MPRVELGEYILRSLEQSYRRLLGDGIPLQIELVDVLEGERSRKFRTIMAVREEGPQSQAGTVAGR